MDLDFLSKLFPFAMPWMGMSFAPDGGGAGGGTAKGAGDGDGSSSSDDDKGDDKPPTKEEFEKLKKDAEAQGKLLAEAQKATADPDYLEYLAAKRRGQASGDGDPKGKKSGSGDGDKQLDLSKVNWEELGNKELAGIIVQVIRNDLKDVASTVEEGVDSLATEVENVKTAMDIDRAAAKYPDFWEYKDEILSTAKANPGISSIKAYHMVKGEKLAKGEIKPESDKSGRGTHQERPTFTPRATKSSKKKSLDEVMEEAWEGAGLSGEFVQS